MNLSINKLLLSSLLLQGAQSFTVPSASYATKHQHETSTHLASSKTDASTEGIALKDTFDNDRASLLASAFDALNEDDKYDAVLTGLCSKILDGKIQVDPEQIGKEATLTPSDLALEKLKDPIRLLGEMNQRRVKASSRSLMALIDAAGSTQDAKAMATVLSLLAKNGVISFYGSRQADITFVPSSDAARAQRLENLAAVPKDNRVEEVSSALTTLTVVGACLLLQGIGNGIGLDNLTPITSIILYFIVGVGIIDNFFDVIQGGVSFVIQMNKEKLPDAVKDAKGVEKSSMPLGIGSGAITGNVVRGLTRLWSVDTERECQCEAAAFYAAYSLGLPCFGFRANALEAAILVFESNKNEQKSDVVLDSLLSELGILKMLIWLMAPVAYEDSLHPQLISSDPKEARGFLMRLKEKAGVFGATQEVNDILRLNEGDAVAEKEVEDLLQWAYAEADILLRNNKSTVNELSESLVSGASTLGDCAALLEEW